MSKIQYISATHSSKERAKHFKKMCNTLHNLYLKDCSFDDLCTLHDAGTIIGRVGRKTDFLMIDVDQSSVTIDKVRDTFRDDPDIHVGYSASMNPNKYHILVDIHKTIDRDEYQAAVHAKFEEIKKRVCDRTDIMVLDEDADNFYQAFFGESVETDIDFILPDSRRLFNWTKKDREPRFYIEAEKREFFSLNSADYCKKHGLMTVVENKRYDIITPSMTRGRLKKIAVGHRYKWCRMIGGKLMMRLFYLNHDFGEAWTSSDLVYTAEWLFRNNVIMTPDFEKDLDELKSWLVKSFEVLAHLPYEEQQKLYDGYFDGSKRQYKSRGFTLSQMSTLLQNRLYDENTVLFTDKEEMKRSCEEMMIDQRTFKEYVDSLHMTIAYECEIKRTRRCKHNVEGMTLDQFNAYCKNNGLSKQLKSKLKRQYNIV